MGITIITVLIARAVVVFTLIPLVNLLSKSKIPFSYQLVSYWGGLRGAVCLALALSINADFPNRDLIVTLTLGIALFTLLIPGTTIGKLIQKLELNRPSILDRLGEAFGLLLAKKATLKEAKNPNRNDYFLPNIIDDFAQKCQQEVELAQQSLIDLVQQLNLSGIEAKQAVWTEALAIERQVYQELQDRGFISQTVLAQVNLMMNLKSDAVQAGQIPPEVTTTKPFEMRLGDVLIKLFDGNPWVKQIQVNLIATNYEYLVFTSYACNQVTLRLRNLLAEIGLPGIATEQCACNYETMGQEIIEQAQTIVNENPESAIALQKRILDRVALVVQNNTIKELAERGEVTETAASQIRELINVS